MKSRGIKSFRFEIIWYSLLSLIYTLLTEGFVYLILYLGGLLIKSIPMQNVPSKDSNPNLKGLSNSLDNYIIIHKDSNSTIKNGVDGVLHEHVVSKYVIFLIVIAVIAGIALFITYFLLLTRKFTNYIEEIAVGINEITLGDFNYRIDIKNDDEFALIASRLNKMAAEIGLMMENERKSENTKNDLITSVAHDLRTPLTSIIGYLELAIKEEKQIEVTNQADIRDNKTRDEILNEKSKRKYIEVAYQKSRRLEKLIEDLFTYTKFSFGEVTLKKTEIDLVKFLDQLVEEFYPSFQEYNLEYDFTTNVNSAIIQADGDLLARAFANLIGNAVKYGKDGKRVRIKLFMNSNKIMISIINYGELIPKKDIDNIFDRFYRVESSRSRDTGGTGLGLAIAKSIILMHGGTIGAKSDFDGTVFDVELTLESKIEV